jgi:hypothetical protein
LGLNTKEVALLGCLIPIFLLFEEITFVLPIPVSIVMVYIFKDAKILTLYALGVSVILTSITLIVFFAGHILFLILVGWNASIDIFFMMCIKKADFNFTNKVLMKIGWSWMIPPTLIIIVIAFPLFIEMVYININAFILFSEVFMIGLFILGILFGYSFKSTFNAFRKIKLDDISNRVGVLLNRFLDFRTGLLYLDTNEVKI